MVVVGFCVFEQCDCRDSRWERAVEVAREGRGRGRVNCCGFEDCGKVIRLICFALLGVIYRRGNSARLIGVSCA